MATKINCTVETPYGTFTRKATKAYTHAAVCEPVARFDFPKGKTPDELRAYIVANSLGSGGVFGRFAKDHGYVVSYHSSEASARKAADKGNSPYLTTRGLGVYPVQIG